MTHLSACAQQASSQGFQSSLFEDPTIRQTCTLLSSLVRLCYGLGSAQAKLLIGIAPWVPHVGIWSNKIWVPVVACHYPFSVTIGPPVVEPSRFLCYPCRISPSGGSQEATHNAGAPGCWALSSLRRNSRLRGDLSACCCASLGERQWGQCVTLLLPF